jgi:transglutaminase-like putative cysteine protease
VASLSAFIVRLIAAMRLYVSHRSTYRYDAPATRVIQVLRLTPRNHDGQYVTAWRIDISADCRLDEQEDAFGNIIHSFVAEGPLPELSVLVEGEVETRDVQGVVRDAVERFPPSLFLRETALTSCDAGISALAATVRQESGEDALAVLHGLLKRLNGEMECVSELAQTATTAAEAFALKRGASADLAHVFIAASRNLGIPARCVGGYYLRDDGPSVSDSGHAWAEAFVPDLGWVAFDIANCLCATDAHARVAVGLDYLGAAPVRGMRYGGGAERLAVAIQIDQASRQAQN